MEAIQKGEAWNKGKRVGKKPPHKPKDIWAIRINLHNACAVRDLALFNLAIDSKLRGCDLVSLRVRDITHGIATDHGAQTQHLLCRARSDQRRFGKCMTRLATTPRDYPRRYRPDMFSPALR